MDVQNLVLAQFEKVTRAKSKWKCILKEGDHDPERQGLAIWESWRGVHMVADLKDSTHSLLIFTIRVLMMCRAD